LQYFPKYRKYPIFSIIFPIYMYHCVKFCKKYDTILTQQQIYYNDDNYIIILSSSSTVIINVIN